MAKAPSVTELIDKLEPQVRRAFYDALNRIKADVRFSQLEASIAAGNVEAALRAVGLSDVYFRPLEEALRSAHLQSGDELFDFVKKQGRRQGIAVTGQFNARNFRAEGILRFHSSDKVVAISNSTRDAVRETLTELMIKGTSPRSAARVLAGKVGPSGSRVGGIIGLDPQKAKWVVNMRDDLEELDIRYFSRKLRDKRFDSAVRRAIAEGKPLNQTTINNIAERYTGRLIKLRAETISRTELLGSLHAAQEEGLEQLRESGEVADDAITTSWRASSDEYTRKDHWAANGQKRKQGEYFDIGGWKMKYPGDTSQGAPASQIANCRCGREVDINFIKGLKERLTPEELAEVRSAMP